MSGHWLSRVRLRADAPAAALAPVLLPAEPQARTGVAHRLLWTLFADQPDRRRDFLWREEGAGGAVPGRTSFLVLSARRPVDGHGLFALESKPFEPALAPGDRLAFTLRANPVVTRADPRTGKARRHDVVMDHLRQLLDTPRAEARLTAAFDAGREWFAGQGDRAGFRLVRDDEGVSLRADGYDQLRIDRGRRGKPIRFSVLDLAGALEVTVPELFLDTLYRGFGKAKAFGCGLMLIRRA
jgi:CRISPR system Cascade subunit CasE